MAAPPGSKDRDEAAEPTEDYAVMQEVETAADPPCDLIRCTLEYSLNLRTCAALVPGWRESEAGCARERKLCCFYPYYSYYQPGTLLRRRLGGRCCSVRAMIDLLRRTR
jgi:hypothetical protein